MVDRQLLKVKVGMSRKLFTNREPFSSVPVCSVLFFHGRSNTVMVWFALDC